MENRVKRFDFRRKLKGLDLASLKELKDYHLDQMLRFLGYNNKESDRQLRYLGYIEDKIKNLENGELRSPTRNERLILTAKLLREKDGIDWQQMEKTKWKH